MEWCCNNGHYWSRTIGNMRKTECRCIDCTSTQRSTDLMNNVLNILNDLGYICKDKLQLVNITRDSCIDITCDKNHTTNVRINRIIAPDYYCRRCVGHERLTITDAQEVAKQRCGECLS